MHKTIIVCCAMVCFTVILSVFFGLYFFYTKHRPSVYTVGDRFTYCLQVAMSESRQSGKVIDVKEATQVCKNVYVEKAN